MTFELTPIDTAPTYDWSYDDQKYALVGRTSRKVHAIFVASDETNAREIRDMMQKINRDSGYYLMKAEH